jgi:hypothetical protein
VTAVLTRRAVLGCIAAGGGLAAARLSAAPRMRRGSLLLIDPALSGVERQAILGRYPGATILELEGDVVRHWRASLRQRFLDNGGAVSVAPWAQSRILFDLAREEGGTAQIVPFGRRMFVVRLTAAGIA